MPKIFISHASEDKDAVALPLAELLKERGLQVWLDSWELTLGDGLRHAIETALSEADFGVIVISPAYLKKRWPLLELDGFFSREAPDRKLILPILHNIRQDELRGTLPILSNRLSKSTDDGLPSVADAIVTAVTRSRSDGDAERKPPAEILSLYRTRMLRAADAKDLRTILYELEDFLRQFPAHPEARLLRDDILNAMHYYEPALSTRMMMPRKRLSPVITVIRFILLAAALYAIYRLIAHFLHH